MSSACRQRLDLFDLRFMNTTVRTVTAEPENLDTLTTSKEARADGATTANRGLRSRQLRSLLRFFFGHSSFCVPDGETQWVRTADRTQCHIERRNILGPDALGAGEINGEPTCQGSPETTESENEVDRRVRPTGFPSLPSSLWESRRFHASSGGFLPFGFFGFLRFN